VIQITKAKVEVEEKKEQQNKTKEKMRKQFRCFDIRRMMS